MCCGPEGSGSGWGRTGEVKALSTMSVKCQAWCDWMWLSRMWASEAGQLREKPAGVGQVTEAAERERRQSEGQGLRVCRQAGAREV